MLIGFDDATHSGAVAQDVRNVVSGNWTRGISLLNIIGINNRISGNYVGVDVGGITGLGNGQANNSSFSGTNVWISNSDGILIGTDSDGLLDVEERNVISSSIIGHGIHLLGGSTGTIVAGNYIGVGADGTTAVGNDGSGIRLGSTANGSHANGSRIGSNDDGTNDDIEANIIANNGTTTAGSTFRNGISVVSNNTTISTNNRISRNVFYSNIGLPIDLNDNLVTVNDGATTATGNQSANILMDYPVITSFSLSGTTLSVAGYVSTCSGAENTAGPTIAGVKIIQIYKEANDGDQDGSLTNGSCARVVSHGEGIQYLGSITGVVNTFSSSFTLPGGVSLVTGDKITAITIDATGNTSEFGVLTSPPLPVKLVHFSARQVEQSIGLNWSTSQEANANRFEIQRSVDTRHWETIGERIAVGESMATVRYSFDDSTPSSGDNYYRLKMIDLDGTFAFSGIQSVNFKNKAVCVYPNPLDFGQPIELSLPINHVERIQVFNSAV